MRIRNISKHKSHLLIRLYKNSLFTTKTTQHFHITEISSLMLFEEITAVYSEYHIKPINKHCGQNAELLNIKVGGIYNYHCALNC
jgi:hypothetical protein